MKQGWGQDFGERYRITESDTERGKSMALKEHGVLAAALTVCVLAALNADCCAELDGRQESLSGVKLVTVHVNCCDLAKEAELDEEEIRSNIASQLEAAGIKVAASPADMGSTLASLL